MTMRVAVLGAAGAMAAVAMRDLLDTVEDVAITGADRRPLALEDPRVSFAELDASNEAATARLLDGHDAVLNAVTYYLNVPVMRAALRARVPYTDLGGLYHGTLKQVELDDAFREAGIPALLGMGSTPGITNVMAGALAGELDRVDEIHVRVGCFDRSASGPLPVPYALDTVLDEFSLPPIVFTNGRAEAVAPLSGRETIDFPPPVGAMEALFTLHSEVAMLPRSFPSLREASFKVAFEPEFVKKMELLVRLGFGSKEPVVAGASPRAMLLALAAKQPSPGGEPADCDALRVDVIGLRGGKREARRAEVLAFPDLPRGIPAGALDTGVPLSIAGQMLAKGEIPGAGVLYPELAVRARRFFEELARRGMRVSGG
jgi:saccharopine dehydrogenase-like NADP-dependent oxidoreductase